MSREIDPVLNKTSMLVTHLLPSDKEKVKQLARSKGLRPGEWLRNLVLNELKQNKNGRVYNGT